MTEGHTAEHWLGRSVKRKEDDRFLQGKGNYVDDINLPGMLHMSILRSPVAHARINSIDTSAAAALPGVVAVVTGELLAQHNLAWMPTLSGDTQAVLATDKVRMQGQEVACVIAEDPYVAHDALELIEVDYDPLPVVITPQQSLEPGAPVIRDDKEDKQDNRVYHWEAGDAEATDRAFAEADRVVSLDTFYPRCHPAPMETCGCVADVNPVTGKATIYMTSQAPHVHRTVFALVAGLPEHQIQIISPDIGGGFGNKVPVYPGYVVATAASLLLGRPVKWIEDRTGNLISTGFARDFYMKGELALREDGKMLGLRVNMLSDQGYAFADAQPSKLKAGLFHIVTGSYDIPAAHVVTDGAYTNKAPGGVAYRCSFRVTEASFFIERLVQTAAYELGVDPAELRRQNFIKPEQFPYTSATGFVYDSGNYEGAMDKALEMLGYEDLKAEQARARDDGKLIGIGLATFTEVVGAGPSKDYDILGLKMFDSAELRVHPTGKAILKIGVQTQGQGHETTFAQIVANELGIPPSDILVQHGDTDNTPYGLGTYASRSTPTAGAATAMVSRKLRDKARQLAAHLLEVAPEDLEWVGDRFQVRGAPDRKTTIQEAAFAAYTNHPQGMEAGLEGVTYYDPPNMTYPFGAYAVAVEVDRGTGQWKVKRMVAVDDCGVRINPMIVEGQIMGGLTEGFAMAAMELITFDELGNCIGSNFSDYLIPTSWETPKFELGETTTPSPHHPIGAKGVGESATVGSPAAFVNAVVDALAHAGVRELQMPIGPDKVWQALVESGPRGVDDGADDPVRGAGRGRAAGRRGQAVRAGHGGPGGPAGLDPAGGPGPGHPRRGPGRVGRRGLLGADRGPRGAAGPGRRRAPPCPDRPGRGGRGRARRRGRGREPLRLRGGGRGPDRTGASGPLLAVLGEGVAGRTLVQLARIIGWRVTDQLDPDAGPDAVVVATMGHGDEDALASALKAGVGYVGLVASARRAAVVLDALREQGVAAEELARVRSPAGRDLGPSTQEEIAVAILAELVDWRHGLAAPARRRPPGRRRPRRRPRRSTRSAA